MGYIELRVSFLIEGTRDDEPAKPSVALIRHSAGYRRENGTISPARSEWIAKLSPAEFKNFIWDWSVRESIPAAGSMGMIEFVRQAVERGIGSSMTVKDV